MARSRARAATFGGLAAIAAIARSAYSAVWLSSEPWLPDRLPFRDVSVLGVPGDRCLCCFFWVRITMTNLLPFSGLSSPLRCAPASRRLCAGGGPARKNCAFQTLAVAKPSFIRRHKYPLTRDQTYSAGRLA